MIKLHTCKINSGCRSFLEDLVVCDDEKMDCIPDLPRVSMLCIMFSGVPCGHDSLNPAAGGGGGEFFSLVRQKVFLRLRLGGWMTRNVIGDFRGLRWFYFFP